MCILKALLLFTTIILNGNKMALGDGEGIGFREVALQRHNYFRDMLNLQPLTLDKEMSVMAQAHAVQLSQIHKLAPSGFGYLENLWQRIGQTRPFTLEARDAVNAFYTGSKIPGNTDVLMDELTLRNNYTRKLGVGLETSDNYVTFVALYL